jgi:hypothetical protein
MPRIKVGLTAEEVMTLELIQSFSRMAAMIPWEDVQALQDRLSLIDTIAPLFDPSAWLDVQDTFPDHQELVRRFAAFRGWLEQFREAGASREGDGD